MTPVVDPEGASSKFKATIDVVNKHFTGIVIVKKTDSVTTHVVFITELGMKMFDLEKKDTSFNAVFIFEPLNKPNLVLALKTNFKNMLLLDVYGKSVKQGETKKKELVYEMTAHKEKHYFVMTDINKLLTQAVFLKKKKFLNISYIYDQELKEYSQIKCVQYGLVKIKIELNKITDSK